MKKCVCSLNEKGQIDKRDLIIGAVVYPILLLIVCDVFGFAWGGGLLATIVISLYVIYSNILTDGHSKKCAFRQSIVKVFGFAGNISPTF